MTTINDSFVYVLINTHNNKKYYGITNNIKKRWNYHIHKSNCVNIFRAIEKYGKENFKMIIMYRGCRDRCLQLEKYFISRYDTCNTGYNIHIGGDESPMYNKKHTDETKAKISKSKKGQKLSDETKEKLSTIRKGRKMSEETKKKISESKKGKKQTPEHIKKLSLIRKGRKLSDITKKKMSESRTGPKNSFYGKKHSQETKNKISKSLRSKK